MSQPPPHGTILEKRRHTLKILTGLLGVGHPVSLLVHVLVDPAEPGVPAGPTAPGVDDGSEHNQQQVLHLQQRILN